MAGAPRQVLVGFDGSAFSVAALNWAVDYAVLTGAVLHPVTVWRWPTAYGLSVPAAPDYHPDEEARRLLEEGIASIRQAHPDLRIEATLAEGLPGPTLVELSKDAELLVLGRRGHGQFAGMLVGSVSQHCIAHARCPVLVIRDHPDSA